VSGLRGIGDSLYVTAGDWVERCTTLAESADGAPQIINWQIGTVPVEAPDATLDQAA